MKKYTTLFFDLDHTLWDFQANSKEALTEIYGIYQLKKKGVSSFEEFLNVYYKINDNMWEQYRKGEITKDELRNDRFYKALIVFDLVDRDLANDIGNYYVKTSPYKTNLFSGCYEIMEKLKAKYALHIITNGFEEVQHIKLRESRLRQYFGEVITSERAGFKKPEIGIFEYSLRLTGAKKEDSLMIGDGIETDIAGARMVGMDQMYFNPHRTTAMVNSTYTVTHLSELLDVL
ncbi:MAG: YjjG family noncanonical pyrimidine nucleotidase [Flavobacteriales bacterium]|nr:YjjG family noncanonical pyrimidine nucleotidase [Flavobacteriales bacterium]